MAKHSQESARQGAVDTLLKLGVLSSADAGTAKRLGSAMYDEVDRAWSFEGELGGTKIGTSYFSYSAPWPPKDDGAPKQSADQQRQRALAACAAALPNVDFSKFRESLQNEKTGALYVFTAPGDFGKKHGWNTVAVKVRPSGLITYFAQYDEPVDDDE